MILNMYNIFRLTEEGGDYLLSSMTRELCYSGAKWLDRG